MAGILEGLLVKEALAGAKEVSRHLRSALGDPARIASAVEAADLWLQGQPHTRARDFLTWAEPARLASIQAVIGDLTRDIDGSGLRQQIDSRLGTVSRDGRGTSSLEEVRRWSVSAIEDAALVSQDRAGVLGGSVRLEQGVYVRRTGLFRSVSRLVRSLSREQPRLAIEVLERAWTSSALTNFGTQAKRDAINHLRTPACELMRLDPSAIERLLDKVPMLDKFLGRLPIDAASHSFEVFRRARPILERLAVDVHVPSELKGLLHSHLAKWVRLGGGSDWDQLYSIGASRKAC